MVDILSKEQAAYTEVGVVFAMKGGPFADSISSNGITIRIIGLKNGFDINPRALYSLYSFYKDYDIIHLHAFNYPMIIVAMLMRKKIVFTIHGLTSLRRPLSIWDKIKNANLNWLIGRGISRLTTVSEFMKTIVQREFNRAKNISIIFNCIQKPPDSRRNPKEHRIELGISHDDFVILTYCTIVSNKRIDILFDALAILKKQNNLKKMRCLVVGDGPHRPILERSAKDLGIDTMVTFIGYTDRVYDFIELSDVCVFPAKNESFGLVVLEVLSMGKVPIVFRDGGGMFEIVNPLPQSIFVVSNLVELAQRINVFKENPEKLQSISSQCRELAAMYSPERAVADYRKIYESCFS